MRQEMWEHNYGDTLSRTPLLVSRVPDCLMSCDHFLGGWSIGGGRETAVPTSCSLLWSVISRCTWVGAE